MKNYLTFQLTGKQLFPLWIIFLVFLIIPYLFVKILKHWEKMIHPQVISLWQIPVYLFLFILVMIWIFYFTRMFIRSIHVNDEVVTCDYSFGKYIGWRFLDLLFSIITFGVYFPWFIRNLQRYFVHNSFFRNNALSFRGKGVNLLVILFFTFFLPLLALPVLTVHFFGPHFIQLSIYYRLIYKLIMCVILIPYIYLAYKWMININYKEYNIQWNTEFSTSVGKIGLELFFSIITLGIYFPMACLRIFSYFVEKTQSSEVDGMRLKFGYDIDSLNDFKMIWGQILLTILTVGIYLPWALCKILKKVLGKTFVEKVIVL